MFRTESIPILGLILVIGDPPPKNAYIATYTSSLSLVLAWMVIHKTRLGLRLRACGELP